MQSVIRNKIVYEHRCFVCKNKIREASLGFAEYQLDNKKFVSLCSKL